MLTQEDDVDAHALRKRGWSISAIARHLGHDRKTIRGYLNDERVAGVRAPAGEDRFAVFVDYCRERLVEDPHLWAMTLFDEVVGARVRPVVSDVHPPAASRVSCARSASVPRGARVGRWRSSITRRVRRRSGTGLISRTRRRRGGGARTRRCSSARSPTRAGGAACSPSRRISHTPSTRSIRSPAPWAGLTRVWRFDRMATVCHPATGRVTASFAGVAKHYGVSVAICPPRRGNRKGVVEKANDTAAQRWWRTLPDDITIEDAQASLDAFCRPCRSTPAAVSSTDDRDTVAVHAARRAADRSRRRRSRRRSPSNARSPRRRWWRSAGTATRPHQRLVADDRQRRLALGFAVHRHHHRRQGS